MDTCNLFSVLETQPLDPAVGIKVARLSGGMPSRFTVPRSVQGPNSAPTSTARAWRSTASLRGMAG